MRLGAHSRAEVERVHLLEEMLQYDRLQTNHSTSPFLSPSSTPQHGGVTGWGKKDNNKKNWKSYICKSEEEAPDQAEVL